MTMRKLTFLAALFGAAIVGGGIAPASAGPLGTAPAHVISAGDFTSNVIQVHGGFHRKCRLGPRGWHRHTRSGFRIACVPWRYKRHY